VIGCEGRGSSEERLWVIDLDGWRGKDGERDRERHATSVKILLLDGNIGVSFRKQMRD
jgi:hypothetical protein